MTEEITDEIPWLTFFYNNLFQKLFFFEQFKWEGTFSLIHDQKENSKGAIVVLLN